MLEYQLSLAGATRAAYLVLILPMVMKLLKPKSPHVQSSADAGPSQPHPSPPKERHSTSFDLNVALVSLFIEAISFTLSGLAPTSLQFILFSMMSSFGAGFSPAMQSIALDLYSRRGGKEIGRLFGAWSVLQALLLLTDYWSSPLWVHIHQNCRSFAIRYLLPFDRDRVSVFCPPVFYTCAGEDSRRGYQQRGRSSGQRNSWHSRRGVG